MEAQWTSNLVAINDESRKIVRRNICKLKKLTSSLGDHIAPVLASDPLQEATPRAASDQEQCLDPDAAESLAMESRPACESREVGRGMDWAVARGQWMGSDLRRAVETVECRADVLLPCGSCWMERLTRDSSNQQEVLDETL